MIVPSSVQNDPIRHVVALILENHSFDQMLGCFKALYPGLEGIDAQHPFVNVDGNGTSFLQMPTTERQMILDPHHEVEHVATQLANGNAGFVLDFAKSYSEVSPTSLQYIMGYYSKALLHALGG